MFLLGTAEVFADTTAGHAAADAGGQATTSAIANARLQVGFITVNQLAGPRRSAPPCSRPAWRWPFVRPGRRASPLGVVLVVADRPPPGAVRGAGDTHVRHDIAEGVRWLSAHPPVRTLALVDRDLQRHLGAAWSVLVLYVAASGSAWARSASAC